MDRRQNFVSGLKILDLLVMVSCFALSAIPFYSSADVASVNEFMAIRISLGNLVLFCGFVALWHLLYSLFGLYGNALFSNVYRKAFDVVKATSIGTCAIVALAVPFDISFIDARFMLVFWISVSVLSFSSRFIARAMLIRYNRHEAHLHRILIVGANTRSVRLARSIQGDPALGCRVIGFVDDTSIHAQSFEEFGFELVSEYKDFSKFLGRTAIDEVLVCLPENSRSGDTSKVMSICEEQGISVGVLRDMFKWKPDTTKIRQFGDQTIITVSPHAIHGGQAVTKRALDIAISAIAIVLLLPVFIITALIIKFTSPGPVIFSQERVGLNKKRFRMLKFRTMLPEAEQQQAALEHYNEAAGPVFKIKDDPRITPVGRFLRKSSIDELPQLVNVLMGDMSIVGPRPLPVRDYEGFTQDWHRRRISIRPGITCLWQVNGRDQSSFDEWMRLDLEYIDHWSLYLDIKVMFKTIPAVLRGSGAT